MYEATWVGLTLMVTTLLAFLWYAVVVRAIWRSIPESSSFILLISQSLADMEIAAGYLFLPWMNARMHSFIYNSAMLPMQAHYVLMAVNRWSATAMPYRYKLDWTRRRCVFAALATWILAIVMSIGIHLADPSDDVYYTHVPEEYAFMARNYTLFEQSILFPIWEWLDYSELLVPLTIYAITIAFSLYRKIAGSGGMNVNLQIEVRLTILCIVNFSPYAAMIIGSLKIPFEGKMGQFARNLLVIVTWNGLLSSSTRDENAANVHDTAMVMVPGRCGGHVTKEWFCLSADWLFGTGEREGSYEDARVSRPPDHSYLCWFESAETARLDALLSSQSLWVQVRARIASNIPLNKQGVIFISQETATKTLSVRCFISP
uniref:G protein-coupled receptor n=1 Tax=Plectus sambesii TaxID=2011161 RepID=A0A914XHN4_9BILA